MNMKTLYLCPSCKTTIQEEPGISRDASFKMHEKRCRLTQVEPVASVKAASTKTTKTAPKPSLGDKVAREMGKRLAEAAMEAFKEGFGGKRPGRR